MLREPGSSGANLQTKPEHRIRSITNATVNAIVNRFGVKVFKHSGQLIYRIAFGVKLYSIGTVNAIVNATVDSIRNPIMRSDNHFCFSRIPNDTSSNSIRENVSLYAAFSVYRMPLCTFDSNREP
jgi:hypothetical protein